MSPEGDPRAELDAIKASLRALLEWHEMTGTTGLPVGDPDVVTDVETTAGQGQLGALPPRGEVPAAVPEPAAPPAPADDRRVRLAVLAEEVRACVRCGLAPTRTQTVFARGNPFAEVCFVGEGPGFDEDRLGEPFVGKAGQLLDRMIAAMGYARDDVYVANIVKCRPPENRKPEPDEMASCSPYLVTQLSLVQPKVIVALGATAVQGLIGSTEGITRMRGKWKLYKGSIPIMPTFHPAYLLRQPAAKREVWNDLQEVMRRVGKTRPARSE